MKIKYLLILILIHFFNSCSEGDDINVDPQVKIKIDKISSSFYSNGELYLTTEDFYENNKIISTNKFNDKLEFIGKVDYQYNSKGLVKNIKYYWFSILGEESIFQYDKKNRLISIKYQQSGLPDQDFSRVFEYMQDDIILESQKDMNGELIALGLFRFYLNDSGLIYKIINEEEDVFEAEFMGNNIISVNTPHSGVYNYSYDNIDNFQGSFYSNMKKNVFGSEINNAALWAGSLINMVEEEVYNDKFMVLQLWGNNKLDVSYELNNEGYPLIRIEKLGGEISKKIEYFYE